MDLNVSLFEEMKLLVKWLDPESKQLANREMIEAALKCKLNSFPKISHKDPKLYYLLDILTEIECERKSTVCNSFVIL